MNVLQDQLTIAFPVQRSDLELWLREPVPYILILYDAQPDVAYWLYVQTYFEQLLGFNLAQAGETVTLRIPKANVLDEKAIRRIAGFKNDVMRRTRRVIHRER